MTDRRPGNARDLERADDFAKHVVERARTPGRSGGGNVSELTEYDATALREASGETELRQHAIDAIRSFIDVFDDEDCIVVVGLVRRASERGQESQVSSNEPAARAPWMEHRCGDGGSARVFAVERAL